jgi:hypothetical protein
MNYLELKQSVQQTCDDFSDEFAVELKGMVLRAEKAVYQDANLPSLKRNAIGYMSRGLQFLDLPDELLSVLSVSINTPQGRKFLLVKDVSFLGEAFPVATIEGLPEYYALYDDAVLLLGPTPDADYETELNYRAYPESITVDDEATTKLSTQFEQVLFWAVMREAVRFQKAEEDVVKNADAMYSQLLPQIKQHAHGWNKQDSYRSGEPRQDVR